ncbi:hypothetical protein PTKIN_Ptkin18bG0030100 [Pterospermum kingtungense]
MEYVDKCVGPVPTPDIVIDAASLVDLKFYDILAESYLLVNLYSLVNAHLEYLLYREDFNPETATNLLKGISNVQSLYVTPDFLRGALRGVALNPSEKVPCCLLSRLKVIEIHSFDGQKKPVEYFLKNARVWQS